MSGTSADGVDAAVVDVFGTGSGLRIETRAALSRAYAADLRERILELCRPGGGSSATISSLSVALGRVFAAAVLEVVAEAGLARESIDLVGSHGQTIYHAPPSRVGRENASTLQIGEPAVIAEITGLPVVSSFRARDVAAGGEGAPLVPYVDYLLLSHPSRGRAVQNIGGIANVTYLPPACHPVWRETARPESSKSSSKSSEAADSARCRVLLLDARGLPLLLPHIAGSHTAPGPSPAEVIAFDTGPGNMVIDGLARRLAGKPCDEDGRLAAAGEVHEGLLNELLDHPCFRTPPPRATGREEFGSGFVAALARRAADLGLSTAATLATATAFTARSIAESYREHLRPHGPVNEVVLSGGGAHNPTLVAMLARELGADVRVMKSDAVGLPVDFKEAIAFAVLASEAVRGRPANLPAVTGADGPRILGSLTAP